MTYSTTSTVTSCQTIEVFNLQVSKVAHDGSFIQLTNDGPLPIDDETEYFMDGFLSSTVGATLFEIDPTTSYLTAAGLDTMVISNIDEAVPDHFPSLVFDNAYLIDATGDTYAGGKCTVTMLLELQCSRDQYTVFVEQGNSPVKLSPTDTSDTILTLHVVPVF